MRWIENAVLGQHPVARLQSGEVVLVCTPLELIGWDGVAGRRAALVDVKRFSREGRELLVVGESGTLLSLPILTAPRAELDAFFAAVKGAMASAKAQNLRPPTPVSSPEAPTVSSAPVSSVPAPVLAPSQPSVPASSIPAQGMAISSGPTAIATAPTEAAPSAPAGEFFWSGELVAPPPAAKPAAMPEARAELELPGLDIPGAPAPELEHPASGQPELELPGLELSGFGLSGFTPPASKQPALETPSSELPGLALLPEPKPEPKPVTEPAPQAAPPAPDPNGSLSEQDRDAFTLGLLQIMEGAESPPTMMDFMLSSANGGPLAGPSPTPSPAASAAPVSVAEQAAPKAPRERERLTRKMSAWQEAPAAPAPGAPKPVGREGNSVAAPKLEPVFSDPLVAPAPRERATPKSEREADLGNGVFQHPEGFKYECASARRRFVALLVDGFLLGIVAAILQRIASSGVSAKQARAEAIVGQLLGGTAGSEQLTNIMKATLGTPGGLDLDPAAPETALVLEYQRITQSLPAEVMMATGIGIALVALAGWAYYAYFESSDSHATPGKRWLGIGVVDAGSVTRLSFAQASKRYWWRYGPVYGLLFVGALFMAGQLRGGVSMAGAVGYFVVVMLAAVLSITDLLVVFFTKKRQTFHDMMAGTLVVKG